MNVQSAPHIYLLLAATMAGVIVALSGKVTLLPPVRAAITWITAFPIRVIFGCMVQRFPLTKARAVAKVASIQTGVFYLTRKFLATVVTPNSNLCKSWMGDSMRANFSDPRRVALFVTKLLFGKSNAVRDAFDWLVAILALCLNTLSTMLVVCLACIAASEGAKVYFASGCLVFVAIKSHSTTNTNQLNDNLRSRQAKAHLRAIFGRTPWLRRERLPAGGNRTSDNHMRTPVLFASCILTRRSR